MNNEEAKFILQAYRPDGRDARDDHFAEALAQAKRDPQLGRWFEKEQAVDALLSAKLKEIAPPANLRANILAGVRVSRSTPWWNRYFWPAAVAAALSLLLMAASFWRGKVGRNQPTPPGFVTTAEDLFTQGKHGGHVSETGTLASILSDTSQKLSDHLKMSFDDLKAAGCHTLTVGGREVLEVCFNRNNGEYHLYVAKADAFPTLNTNINEIHRAKGFSSAHWTQNGLSYVLISPDSKSEFQSLI